MGDKNKVDKILVGEPQGKRLSGGQHCLQDCYLGHTVSTWQEFYCTTLKQNWTAAYNTHKKRVIQRSQQRGTDRGEGGRQINSVYIT
jgi:hypothetical protein